MKSNIGKAKQRERMLKKLEERKKTKRIRTTTKQTRNTTIILGR